MLTHANTLLGRHLALLVALIFLAIPVAADFAEARLPAPDVSFYAAEVPRGGTAGFPTVATWAEPGCALSAAPQLASAPCQMEKHMAGSPAAIADRAPARYMPLQDARLPAWHITPHDRPPNRLAV